MFVNVNGKCLKCGENLTLSANITPTQLAPVVRSNIKPTSSVFVYRITSDDVKKYLIEKAKHYAPDVKMEVVPRFIEKKKRKSNEPHRACASLRIAFSENVVEKNQENGWFGKIGQSDSVRIIKSIFQQFVQMYSYEKDGLKKIKNDYKCMEELEDALGITEAYLDDLILFSSPRVITIGSHSSRWVVFAAAAEKVIQDMLTVAETGKSPGSIVIQDTIQISTDAVEYLVYVYPDRVVTEDPSVRRILLGEEKAKID